MYPATISTTFCAHRVFIDQYRAKTMTKKIRNVSVVNVIESREGYIEGEALQEFRARGRSGFALPVNPFYLCTAWHWSRYSISTATRAAWRWKMFTGTAFLNGLMEIL